jgi:hypothetical protein
MILSIFELFIPADNTFGTGLSLDVGMAVAVFQLFSALLNLS